MDIAADVDANREIRKITKEDFWYKFSYYEPYTAP